MTTPQFVNNFANPAFMASMAPGCALGNLITSANEFMEIVPGTDTQIQIVHTRACLTRRKKGTTRGRMGRNNPGKFMISISIKIS